jgi:hypothetical protein
MISTLNPELGATAARDEIANLMRRHFVAGWWLVLAFLSLGLLLEVLHAFKLPFYLDVSNHTRRLMWTLAHAHGTLLGLVQIAFAATLPHLSQWRPRHRSFASAGLLGSALLIPTGFFLGGTVVHAGDPGLGILLVPLGALLLLLAVSMTVSGFYVVSPKGTAGTDVSAKRTSPAKGCRT